MRLPLVIIHFERWDFPLIINHPAIKGYPHDYGNPHMIGLPQPISNGHQMISLQVFVGDACRQKKAHTGVAWASLPHSAEVLKFSRTQLRQWLWGTHDHMYIYIYYYYCHYYYYCYSYYYCYNYYYIGRNII